MPRIEMKMGENHDGAHSQHIRAAANLIEWSGLAVWQRELSCFQASEDHEFVERHKDRGEFGRVISWLVFSVGAEYLAKGVCLANGVVNPHKVKVLRYPPVEGSIDAWVTDVLRGTAPKVHQITYGTLGDYYGRRRSATYFGKLRQNGRLSEEKFRLVVAGYRLLGEAIRNRDVHSYFREARGGHFYLVEKLFVPCFNALLEALPTQVGEHKSHH